MPGFDRLGKPARRAVLLLPLFLACDNDPEPMGPAYSVAYAQPDCGPAGGPAVRVTLAQAEPPDSLTDPVPHLSFYLFTNVNELDGRSFSLHPNDHDGSAQFCAAEGSCLTAIDGRIRFSEVVIGSHLTGTYDATLPAGNRQAGRFRAAWRERQVFCL